MGSVLAPPQPAGHRETASAPTRGSQCAPHADGTRKPAAPPRLCARLRSLRLQGSGAGAGARWAHRCCLP
eukprot:3022332-Prymnesium_polylepis.1